MGAALLSWHSCHILELKVGVITCTRSGVRVDLFMFPKMTYESYTINNLPIFRKELDFDQSYIISVVLMGMYKH